MLKNVKVDYRTNFKLFGNVISIENSYLSNYNKTSFLVQIKFITEDSNGLYLSRSLGVLTGMKVNDTESREIQK